jgi:hypothetical protein
MKIRTRNLTVLGIATLILVSTAASVSADTVSFQQGLDNIFVTGYAGTEDNQLMDPGTGFADANIGGRNAVQIGNASSITTRRSIVRFGGLGVMAGQYSSIDAAKIVFRKANAPAGPGTDDISVHAVADNNADWVEGNSQFVVTAGESSWNSKQHTIAAWIGGGGGGALGAPMDTVVGASSNDAANTFYEFDILPALVDQWITGINAGVVFKEVNEIDGAGSGTELQIEWYSSEFGAIADAPVRPRLEITFTPIPEPATFGLLGLASLLMMVGCRRQC